MVNVCYSYVTIAGDHKGKDHNNKDNDDDDNDEDDDDDVDAATICTVLQNVLRMINGNL